MPRVSLNSPKPHSLMVLETFLRGMSGKIINKKKLLFCNSKLARPAMHYYDIVYILVKKKTNLLKA